MTQMRMTVQRRKILEAVAGVHTHISAEEIHCRLIGEMPELSLSTVYRNLKVLADAGKVSVTDLGNGLVYEAVTSIPHHHLVCLMCKRVEPLDHLLVAPLFAELEQQGFQVATNHLCIYGVCRACQSEATG
ncbi:MAG TPA: transcriptional repressor [Anaerolineaceae bacterium]|jgi:Fur family ferric uptake transcriptional regulator